MRLALEKLGGKRYAEFALLTDKVKVHGWQETLEAPKDLTFYGPRDLAAFGDAAKYPELAQSDSVVVVTSARDTLGLPKLRGLRILPVSR